MHTAGVAFKMAVIVIASEAADVMALEDAATTASKTVILMAYTAVALMAAFELVAVKASDISTVIVTFEFVAAVVSTVMLRVIVIMIAFKLAVAAASDALISRSRVQLPVQMI